MGALTDIVKRYVPATYKAMIGASGVTDYYSVTELQALADFVQLKLFSTIAGTMAEISVYNGLQKEFLGIVTTLQFIPVAVEYWGDQLIQETVGGGAGSTQGSVTYLDRREELWKIFDKLEKEAEELAVLVGIPINAARSVVPRVSYGDNGRGILVTPDPQDFGPAFDTCPPDSFIPWVNS